MVAPQQLGLTRVFADFTLLPYLLRRLPPVPRYQKPEIPRRWYRSLRSLVNPDHIEDDDIPKGERIEDYMADDVWQLMRRLDLITPEGNLSSVARSMLAQQRAADDYTALSETLATQIKTHYRGLLDLSIIELLQESARGLANGDSPWAGYSPGLLLIEIQYLIELAHFDADSAQQQPRLLAARRDEALSTADMAEPDPGVHDIQNTIEHADAVADFYLSNLIPVGRQTMTLTEIRSTAMLFTFTGLLTELSLAGPVQCLGAPEGE